MTAPTIRPATEADLSVINDIYNHYVLHSTCTFQEEPSTAVERQVWFAAHGAAHPVMVAVEEGQVVGWSSLSPFHTRSAYRRTVENSIYVRHDCMRRGIGSALLADLIEQSRRLGHHTVVACIDLDQPASITMHRKFGFDEAGRLRQVGFKFGRWLDVIYLQRIL